MSETTYDVRIWGLTHYTGKRGTTYRVRWVTAAQEHRRSFKTKALADSFRSDLVSAQRKGEAFAVDAGLPISMTRTVSELSRFDFACAYVDMKWPTCRATPARASPKR